MASMLPDLENMTAEDILVSLTEKVNGYFANCIEINNLPPKSRAGRQKKHFLHACKRLWKS